MKTILYITEESPFPAYGGGRIRRYGILKALSASGYRVHAIVGNKFKTDLNCFKIENVSFYEFNYRSNKLSVISRYFTIFTKNRKRMRLIRELMAAYPIDIVFLDCYFIGQYILFFQDRNIPVIYGTENAQSRLTRMKPAKKPLKKLETYVNYLLQSFHERLFYPRADAVIAVSHKDFQFYKRFVDEDKIHIVPNFLDFTKYDCRGEKDNYIVMTGSFRAYMNSAGLTWFLENVWDDELSRCTRLIVAGYYSRELLEKVKQKSGNLENVHAVGEVDDITPYIARAKIAVVPLLHGSGSRVKILEAMALRTLVISTGKGAEGLDHENSIIISDSPGDFKNEIVKAITGSDAGYYQTKIENAYQVAVKKYSFEVNRIKMEKILDCCFEESPQITQIYTD